MRAGITLHLDMGAMDVLPSMHVSRLLLLLSLVSTLSACANAVVGGDAPDAGILNEPRVDAADTPDVDASEDSPAACDDVPSGWSRVGDAIVPPGGLFDMGDVAMDSQGRPVVVFSSGSPSDGYVYRFNGSDWEQLGDSFNQNGGNSSVYDLSIRAQGADLVAMFIEAGGATSSGVYVQRLAAGSSVWSPMGGGDLSTTNANVVGSDMLVDGNELLVAWSQYSEGFIGRSRVHVRRFTGDAYVPLAPFMGGIAGPGASAITPSLAIDGAGHEVVFFSESGVRHLERNDDNSDWDYRGEVSPGSSLNGGFSPQSSTDSLGRVVMTMAEFDDTADANVAFLGRWNGASFDSLGKFEAIAGTGTHVTPVDIVIDDNDDAIIAITELDAQGGTAQLFVGRRGAGDVFTTLGGSNLTGGDGSQGVLGPKMVKDACGLHVVFAEAVDAESERTVHVFRWKD